MEWGVVNGRGWGGHSCQPSRSRRDTKAPVPLPPDGGLGLLLVSTEQTWLNLSQKSLSHVNTLQSIQQLTYTKMGVVWESGRGISKFSTCLRARAGLSLLIRKVGNYIWVGAGEVEGGGGWGKWKGVGWGAGKWKWKGVGWGPGKWKGWGPGSGKGWGVG